MFGTNYFQEGLEGFDQGMIPPEMPGFFLPAFDHFNMEMLQKDFLGVPQLNDSEAPDHTQLFQILDQAMQNIPEELKNWFPFPFDFPVPPSSEFAQISNPMIIKKPGEPSSQIKIGSISLEERKIKVQKFLEKRKHRNFKKKISYMCRKKVADKRVRIKGRFVSKIQAEAILGEKDGPVRSD
ncbi:hypothetical protein SteCoe_18781 [Stentor coeruleus]|uniref:CCT domain-containing protein n=1 Tax=Stentor coeruleus TaxID=5963 RepID=A0A1R2BVQ8_9CILI|nr:hypothetical protein SteCoe_18781 [Stentor coeruleus]